MLCKVCQNFNLDEVTWDGLLIYRHHSDSAALKDSADDGCELCQIISKASTYFEWQSCPEISLYYYPDNKRRDLLTQNFRSPDPSDSGKYALELPLRLNLQWRQWGGFSSVDNVLEIVELPGEQQSLLNNRGSSLMTRLRRFSNGCHERVYS